MPMTMDAGEDETVLDLGTTSPDHCPCQGDAAVDARKALTGLPISDATTGVARSRRSGSIGRRRARAGADERRPRRRADPRSIPGRYLVRGERGRVDHRPGARERRGQPARTASRLPTLTRGGVSGSLGRHFDRVYRHALDAGAAREESCPDPVAVVRRRPTNINADEAPSSSSRRPSSRPSMTSCPRIW